MLAIFICVIIRLADQLHKMCEDMSQLLSTSKGLHQL